MSLLKLVYLLPLIGLWVFAGLDEPITMIAIATTLFLVIKTHTLLIYRDRQLRRSPEFRLDFASCLGWYAVWWGLKPSRSGWRVYCWRMNWFREPFWQGAFAVTSQSSGAYDYGFNCLCLTPKSICEIGFCDSAFTV